MASVAPVEAYQNEWELGQLLRIVEDLKPQLILEVGAMFGGTLWHWLRIAERVVVIDDEMRNEAEWLKWSFDQNVSLELLRGKSQDPENITDAWQDAPYDFIFIDGDHRYEAVRADWENFSPMVAPGGVFAFHDTQHVGDPTYGVERLWNEITQEPDVRWVHICMTHHCGIGLVFF